MRQQLRVVEHEPRVAHVVVTGRACMVRQNIAERRRELAEHDDVGAVDVTASLLGRWGEDFFRLVPQVAADRTPRFRNKQLDGEHGLPLEDFWLLVLRRPEVARAGLSLALEAAGFRPLELADGEEDQETVVETTAKTVEAFGGALTSWVLAAADGEVSKREATTLLPLADRLLNAVIDWRSSLRRTAGEEGP
jgi:hypothetical protein